MRGLMPNALSVAVIGALSLSALLHAGPITVLEAAIQGDAATVRALLKSGSDVSAASADGMTALHWAANTDNAEIARILLQAGANTKATTALGGYTPLLVASKNGSLAVLRTLLDGGSDPNVATTNGTTPLMFAAASGQAEAVRLLLDRGANVNAREAQGKSALTFAAASGRTAAVNLLAAHGADPTVATTVVDLYSVGRTAAAEGAVPGQAAPPAKGPQIAGVTRRYLLSELVGMQGGFTPLLMASRQGHVETASALLAAGADVNQSSAGDHTSPLLVAIINGHFDLARLLLEKGADPGVASENGVTPLYGVLNCQWAPKADYPQPRAFEQQHVSYLELMSALLDKGADPNARLKKKVWYSNYNHDLSSIDETGATPFWRAAYASDLAAMRLLVARGADPDISTVKTVGRPQAADNTRDVKEVSNVPPVPIGGPGITPLLAAAGAGYGEGSAGNQHRFAPTGMLQAVKYLVEDLHVDVNAQDHEGNTALHNAASRGDNEMILYLVSKGANVLAVNREGKTTVDMANGPVQRIQPFPETIALLERLGARNNHHCVSC